MHHKFAIVDNRKVIAGSLNWTRNPSNNYENIFISHDPQILACYRQEFAPLMDLMAPVALG
jgi:cardiolipin hydrolase